MNPLPPGFFLLPKTCSHCHHYGFRARQPEEGIGWAFCGHFGKHFLHQLGTPDENGEIHTPAGLRTCKNWIQKGTV